MAFSVYSLRISNDLPVQSDYIPRITYFFTFSMFINVLVMVWFVQLNIFKSKVYLPRIYEVLVKLLQNMHCKKVNKDKVEPITNKSNEIEIESSKTNDNKAEKKQNLEIQFEIMNYFMFFFFCSFSLLSVVLTLFSP